MAGDPTSAPILACVFDMDGVLRHWAPDNHHAMEEAAGLPRGALVAAAFSVPEYEQGVLGLVTYDRWCSATEQAIAEEYGAPAARAAVEAMRTDRGRVDPEAVRLVEEVAARMPAVLLSNAHDRLLDDLRHHGLEGLFAAVVCSAAERIAKPDAEIYRRAAHAAGVVPESCFFTDDLEANVVAAREVGMRACVFTSVAALRRDLFDLGVLAPPP